jgi:cytochrome b pre-mRNA-processing protein 3
MPRMIDRLVSFLRPRANPREKMRGLYNNIVRSARSPHWYVQGGVPDTLDGRFDMLAAITAITLLRLEKSPEYMDESVFLTEIFIADMDEQLRQIGIGDVGISKQVGKIMSAMGGRLGAYRDALGPDAPVGALDAAMVRNIWRGVADHPADPAYVAREVRNIYAGLLAITPPKLITGAWPG